MVQNGTISELVQLAKTGSQKAQEMAAAGLSDLARGAIAEKEKQQKEASKSAWKSAWKRSSAAAREDEPSAADKADKADKAEEGGEGKAEADRLVLISEAGGIAPLVSMLASANSHARENAAGALMHLALDPSNSLAISRAGGIAPLVTLLDDGTAQAHQHAADALLRLANGNEENQTQSAKHLVTLLTNEREGAQCRAARVLGKLALKNPGSPVIIVNAGAISPLVTLLCSGTADAPGDTHMTTFTVSKRATWAWAGTW